MLSQTYVLTMNMMLIQIGKNDKLSMLGLELRMSYRSLLGTCKPLL